MQSLTNNAYLTLIDMLKNSDIDGCITGSSLWAYDTDISGWGADVDVFCYTIEGFVAACCEAVYKFGFDFASDGERWKWERTIERGIKRAKGGAPACTIKFVSPDLPMLNISIKPDQTSVSDVITAFDQTCIMHGYDIQKRVEVDFREDYTGDAWVSMLNPLRKQDSDVYTVKTWLRQTDRLAKYSQRGFDVSQAAIRYIDMIDHALRYGALFESEDAIAFFESATAEFQKVRNNLVIFLRDEYDIEYKGGAE